MDIKFSSPQISKVILGFHPPQVKIMERERERERPNSSFHIWHFILPYLKLKDLHRFEQNNKMLLLFNFIF